MLSRQSRRTPESQSGSTSLGGGTKLGETKRIDSGPDDEDSPLFKIKEEADNFYQELKDGKHKYRRL